MDKSKMARMGLNCRDIEYMGAKAGEVAMRNVCTYGFAVDLVNSILDTLLTPELDGHFYMLITHYANQALGPDYTIELTNAADEDRSYAAAITGFKSKPEEFLQLFSTEIGQSYLFVDGENHANDYVGTVDIRVVTFGNEETPLGSKEACFVPNDLAKILAQSALCCYYDVFKIHHISKQVLYIDAPEIDSYKIDGCADV